MSCSHPAKLNGMCVKCGKLLPNSENQSQGIPQNNGNFTKNSLLTIRGGSVLELSQDEALKIQTEKVIGLQRAKKLALVLDLDHTLLHAVQIEGPTPRTTVVADGQIHHLPIEETIGGSVKHLVMKKRPHLDEFLAQANEYFQMSIYTAGTRRYAEAVVQAIDPSGRYIADRIVSRSDGVTAGKVETIDKSLEKIFLKDASMAIILDDREDVWKGPQQQHLYLVRPYVYFYPGGAGSYSIGATGAVAEVNHGPGQSSASSSNNSEIPSPVISLHASPGQVIRRAVSTSPDYTEADDQLLRCLSVLKQIHQQYFTQLNQYQLSSSLSLSLAPKPSVANVLNDYKRSILAGCTITFSGLIPTNEESPERHFLWKLAESLGAQVSLDVLPRTTHLLATQTSTKKVTSCLLHRSHNVWVLHPDWLLYCRWSLSRAAEVTFLLSALAPGQALPNPILNNAPLTPPVSMRPNNSADTFSKKNAPLPKAAAAAAAITTTHEVGVESTAPRSAMNTGVNQSRKRVADEMKASIVDEDESEEEGVVRPAKVLRGSFGKDSNTKDELVDEYGVSTWQCGADDDAVDLDDADEAELEYEDTSAERADDQYYYPEEGLDSPLSRSGEFLSSSDTEEGAIGFHQLLGRDDENASPGSSANSSDYEDSDEDFSDLERILRNRNSNSNS